MMGVGGNWVSSVRGEKRGGRGLERALGVRGADERLKSRFRLRAVLKVEGQKDEDGMKKVDD
jgi:hypothetical protein